LDASLLAERFPDVCREQANLIVIQVLGVSAEWIGVGASAEIRDTDEREFFLHPASSLCAH
jgi:hypothetical protein